MLGNVRTERPSWGQSTVHGVVGFAYDFDHDPQRLEPELNQSIRRYDKGQYYLVYNKVLLRWQIVAVYKGTLRLVKTWQTSEGDYLPLSMKVYDWLKEGDPDVRFGTRDPDKIDRALRNLEAEREHKQEAWVASEISDYKRYERHVLAHWHAKWQKKGAFDPAFLYPNAGKKILKTAIKRGR